MVFSKEWFKKYQRILLIFANTSFGRRILCIHGERSSVGRNKITRILPHAIEWNNADGTKTIEFRTHEKFGKRLYYSFRYLWLMLHLWDSIFPNLNLGFDTLISYPDADPEITTVDGVLQRFADPAQSWASLRTGAGTVADPTDDASECVAIQAFFDANTWSTINRSIYLFDTSIIGADKNIISSTFIVSSAGLVNLNTFSSPFLDVNVYSSNPASNTNLVPSDFSRLGTTQFSTTITYNNWVAGPNRFPLNTNGINAISKTTG